MKCKDCGKPVKGLYGICRKCFRHQLMVERGPGKPPGRR